MGPNSGGLPISPGQHVRGRLYVAVVLNCFSRRRVGWAMAEHMRAELVVEALERAVWQRKPAPGLVHRSDIRRRLWPTRRDAQGASGWIAGWYHRRRLYSALGYRSPRLRNSTLVGAVRASPLRGSHPYQRQSGRTLCSPVSTCPPNSHERSRAGAILCVVQRPKEEVSWCSWGSTGYPAGGVVCKGAEARSSVKGMCRRISTAGLARRRARTVVQARVEMMSSAA
jgi:hypothetical protein